MRRCLVRTPSLAAFLFLGLAAASPAADETKYDRNAFFGEANAQGTVPAPRAEK